MKKRATVAAVYTTSPYPRTPAEIGREVHRGRPPSPSLPAPGLNTSGWGRSCKRTRRRGSARARERWPSGIRTGKRPGRFVATANGRSRSGRWRSQPLGATFSLLLALFHVLDYLLVEPRAVGWQPGEGDLRALGRAPVPHGLRLLVAGSVHTQVPVRVGVTSAPGAQEVAKLQVGMALLALGEDCPRAPRPRRQRE